MDLGSYVPYAAAALILVGTLASGPLSLADRPTDGMNGIGTGSVEISDVTLPETATLRQGRYGENSFYLQVPDATVAIDRLEGRPVLTYKLEIPELRYSRESTFFLGSNTGDDMRLSLERDQIEPNSVRNESYTGELRVTDRTDNESRIVAKRNITVRVHR